MRQLPIRIPARILLPIACGLMLAGCGSDTARTLGFTRDAPDEFSVVTRAPLSLPPTLGSLPAPRPGLQRPQELRGRAAGEAVLAPGAAFGVGAAQSASQGESALLAQAGQASGAGAVPGGDIRQRVDAEATRLEQPDRSVVDRLMFWRDAPQAGTALDPTREAQRLRENSALGRSVEDGETPVVQRRRQGLFQGLF
jgi:hypothetical protein